MSAPRHTPADVAIVGMSTLLPKANRTADFWRNVLAKVDAITEIPAHRWDWRLYYDEDRKAEDKIYSKWGGFLDDLPFDPTRYGMPPNSLRSVDPMQLMALEVARRALADAGYEERELDRENTSVIVGASGGAGDVGMQYGLRAELPRFHGELPRAVADRLPAWTEDSFPGILLNVVAGRIANRLDLGGTNFVTDAACASSLTAVYLGVGELLSGRSNVVLAGGVDTVQGPFGYLCFSKTQALSPRGRCRTFDATADGIVISEGLAMLVLKRLADAERDGDRIYAVLKGVAGSSDGRAKGLSAPLPAGQLRAMRRAYAQAGFGPETVELFEAHGTGTVAGDTAELESTTQLIRDAGGRPRQAAVGSVKSLIGHTKASAGIVGLVKAALALHHRVLPPHHGVEQPIPALLDAECPLYLIDEARPWLALPDRPRRAAVSSFGFGGTNFHAVLEEHPGAPDLAPPALVREDGAAELFLWHAADRAALRQLVAEQRAELDAPAPAGLRALATGLARAWRGGEESLAVVAGDRGELASKLDAALAFLDGKTARLLPGVAHGAAPDPAAKLAVLFSGQGSQYPDMLRELAVYSPVLARTLDEADELLRERFTARFGPERWLSRFIYPRAARSEAKRTAAELTSTDVAQPALGAVETGLWRLMRRLGLSPDMLGGHSYGEFVALHAAGQIDFAGLMQLSESRGRFIVDAVKEAGGGLGTMAAIQAERAAVEAAVAGIADVVVANHNAPLQCIVSGSEAGIAEAIERCSAAGMTATAVPVAAAFHSPNVAPALGSLAALIAQMSWSPGAIPVYSNTTGEAHSADPEEVRRVMARHLVRPVEFVAEVEAMYRDGARTFLELGPKSVLASLVGRVLGERPHRAISVDGKGGGVAGLLRACGELLCAGVALDLGQLFPDDAAAAGSEPSSGRHVWLLNGSGARRAHEPVRHVGVLHEGREVATEAAPAEPRPDAAPAAGPRSSNTASPSTTTTEEREMIPHDENGAGARRWAPAPLPADVMAEYFATMRKFLETQEQVMSRLLDGTPRARRPIALPTGNGPTRPARTGAAEERTPREAAPAPPAVAAPPAPAPEPVAAEEPRPEPTPAPAAADGSSNGKGGVDRERMKDLLLSIVEEKTGYPPDMVGMDQNLEADLGIDSIKRVEIAGALLKALPPQYGETLGEDRARILRSTLNGMIDVLEELQKEGGVSVPFDRAETGAQATVPGLPSRQVLEPGTEEIDPQAARRLQPGRFLLTRDARGVAAELAALLEARGRAVSLVDAELLCDEERLCQLAGGLGDVAGLVHLAPLDAEWLPAESPGEAWRRQLARNEKSPFVLLKACGEHLRRDAHVLCASALGGCFGRDARERAGLSLQGGAVGLVKSLKEERPELRAKAVDVDHEQDAAAIARALLDELELVGGRLEVGYPGGRRTVFRTVAAARPAASEEDAGGLCVLATGGLRGVTAELLRELARPGNTLLVTGRSVLPGEEAPETRALETADALRQHYIAEVRSGRAQLNPAEVGQRIRSLLAAREMRANVEDFRRRGAVVEYFSVDATDERAMGELFSAIQARHGAVHGVLHGAGVLEDRLLEDMTSDGWSLVVDTKVLGLLNLRRYVDPDALRFFTVLSSVAGRYGNSGQTAYATANELMNRLCCQLRDVWRGRVRVRALCWGPWGATQHGAGMVTAETAAKFAAKGVRLVEAEEGRRLFAAELSGADDAPVEVVCGAGPWEEHERTVGRCEREERPAPATLGPLLAEVELRTAPGGERTVVFELPASHAYLADHRIDGTPVLPAAVALELMAQAAQGLWPGWLAVEVRECRALKGIELKRAGMRFELVAREAPGASGEELELDVAIRSGAGETPPRTHYRATLRMAQRLSEGGTRRITRAHTEQQLDTGKAYGEWLFHGPRFQVIERIDGLSAAGARAHVRTTRPEEWIQGDAARGARWVFDPGLVDAAAQMAWLWTRAHVDESALPARFGRVVRCADALPERVTMDFERIDSGDPHVIRADVVFADERGRVLLRIEDLESVASAALNRLGGTAGAPAGESTGPAAKRGSDPKHPRRHP